MHEELCERQQFNAHYPQINPHAKLHAHLPTYYTDTYAINQSIAWVNNHSVI